MGNWQLEVAKMAIYMAFPVTSFYVYHQVGGQVAFLSGPLVKMVGLRNGYLINLGISVWLMPVPPVISGGRATINP